MCPTQENYESHTVKHSVQTNKNTPDSLIHEYAEKKVAQKTERRSLDTDKTETYHKQKKITKSFSKTSTRNSNVNDSSIQKDDIAKVLSDQDYFRCQDRFDPVVKTATTELSSASLYDDDIHIPVQLEKSHKGTKLGLRLKMAINGQLVVENVMPDSLADRANIKVGQKLLYINSIKCEGMKMSQVVCLLGELVGSITIILSKHNLVTVGFYRDNKRVPLGVVLSNSRNEFGDSVRIAKILPGSLVGNSKLKLGQKIISINTIECDGLDEKQITSLLNELEGMIEITAQICDEPENDLEYDTVDSVYSTGSAAVSTDVGSTITGDETYEDEDTALSSMGTHTMHSSFSYTDVIRKTPQSNFIQKISQVFKCVDENKYTEDDYGEVFQCRNDVDSFEDDVDYRPSEDEI